MAEVVIEVHSISAAPLGWKTVQSKQPVVCFALVTTTTAEHPGSFSERRVIPLTNGDLNVNLLGRVVDELEDDAFHPDNEL